MRDSKVRDMTCIALMAAVICILGPLSIPIGPVPISLTNLAIFFTLYIIGMRRGLWSLAIYLLLGLVGMPVFSGFAGGPQKLFGPTGGYIIGFIFMALIAGVIIDKHYKNRVLCIIAMVVATIVLYILGTAWLAYSAHMTFQAALAVGVIPFAAEDFVKILICAILGPVLRERLEKAGVLQYRTAVSR